MTLESPMKTRSYRELKRINTFEDRFEYLKLNSSIGIETFGFDRWLNQAFYTSVEWRRVRDHVIARDLGRDMDVEGREIFDKVVVHHMNPMTLEQVRSGDPAIVDPDFLITVSGITHNAIHYGDSSLLVMLPVERRPGDTKLW
jgi:hypothetical protein